MQADVRREKGGLVMTAQVGSMGIPAGNGAGGGGYDVRWNAETAMLEKSSDGVTWIEVIQFYAYDV